MPEKKAQGKPSFFKRVANFFMKIGLAFKNMVAELKKVTWPSRKELVNYSIVVIAFMVLMAVVIGLLDLGASQLVQALIRL